MASMMGAFCGRMGYNDLEVLISRFQVSPLQIFRPLLGSVHMYGTAVQRTPCQGLKVLIKRLTISLSQTALQSAQLRIWQAPATGMRIAGLKFTGRCLLLQATLPLIRCAVPGHPLMEALGMQACTLKGAVQSLCTARSLDHVDSARLSLTADPGSQWSEAGHRGADRDSPRGAVLRAAAVQRGPAHRGGHRQGVGGRHLQHAVQG